MSSVASGTGANPSITMTAFSQPRNRFLAFFQGGTTISANDGTLIANLTSVEGEVFWGTTDGDNTASITMANAEWKAIGTQMALRGVSGDANITAGNVGAQASVPTPTVNANANAIATTSAQAFVPTPDIDILASGDTNAKPATVVATATIPGVVVTILPYNWPADGGTGWPQTNNEVWDSDSGENWPQDNDPDNWPQTTGDNW
jgi:hypothetical protein